MSILGYKVESNEIESRQIPGADNVSDLMTKESFKKTDMEVHRNAWVPAKGNMLKASPLSSRHCFLWLKAF